MPPRRSARSTSNRSSYQPTRPHGTDAPPISDLRSLLLGLTFAFLALFPWLRLGDMTYALTMQFFIAIFATSGLAILLLIGYATGSLRLPVSRAFWVVGLLAAVRIISAVTSILPYKSLWGAYTYHTDGLAFFLACAVLFLAIVSLELRERELRVLFVILTVQATILCGQTVLEGLRHHGVNGYRARSPLYNADYFLSYLALILPLTASSARQAWREARELVRPVVASLPFLLALWSGYLTVPADLRALLLPSASPTVSGEPVPFLENTANAERFTLWRVGLAMGNDRPLLGNGPGTIRAAFYRHTVDLPGWDYNVAPDAPHNDLIEQYASTGIVGVTAYLAAWVTLAVLWFRRRRTLTPHLTPPLVSLAAGLLLFFLFNQVAFTVVQTGLFVWAFAAVLIYQLGGVRYVALRQSGLIPRVAIPLTLFASIVAAYYTWPYFRAEQLATRGLAQAKIAKVGLAADAFAEASDRFPYEESYARLTSANSFYQSIALRGQVAESVRSPYSQRSLTYADRAVARNRYLPENALNAGVVGYVLSEPDSTSETAAREYLREALRISPWDLRQYRAIYQGYTLKRTGTPTEAELQFLYDLAPADFQPIVRAALEKST